MCIKTLTSAASILLLTGCMYQHTRFAPDDSLNYCIRKLETALPGLPDAARSPRSIPAGATEWTTVGVDDWTSGYFPGILWYAYEYTGDENIRHEAVRFTQALRSLPETVGNHDLGIMTFASMANAYRLTGDTLFRNTLLRAAERLSRLYNPVVGTIHSWPYMVESKGWPHNTIIDNMINIELLFWAARNGGEHRFRDIACRHARTTLENHFRADYSTFHVVVYDTIGGKALRRITHQGYSDSSLWARGQAWAVYGFTTAGRESGDPEFLHAARRAADRYLERLPADGIPYWDFDDPAIPDAPRDASAAAIMASGLIELARLTDGVEGQTYRKAAEHMLRTLSAAPYRSGNANRAFLLHCVGHKPNGSEVDASIVYGDYYYLEALIRLHRAEKNTRKSAD